MSLQPCWRCLSRAPESAASYYLFSQTRLPASTALFSTSTSALAKVTTPVPQRGARTTFIKKKQKPKTDVKAKKPAPGERKAYRKRVVLSNTNALPVAGLEQFSVESLGTEELKGKVLSIPGEVVDQLRAVEAFKPTQAWGLFRQAGMLVRNETLQYAKLLGELQTEGNTLRRVLVGERGSGKSLMALQAMTIAFLRGWTVINIPEGISSLRPRDKIISSLAHRQYSAGTNNWPLRLLAPFRHLSSPLRPKNLHRQTPLPNLKSKPASREPPNLDHTALQLPDTDSIQHLSSFPRRSRCL